MKRLLLLCVSMNVLTAIVCFGALGYGRTQPAFDLVNFVGLDYCNAKPCLRGVILGETGWNDAVAHFHIRGGAARIAKTFLAKSDKFEYSVANSGAAVVSSISATVKNWTPPILGEIVGQYGEPCLISYLRSAWGDMRITFVFPHLRADTSLTLSDIAKLEPDESVWRLIPRIPISSVVFSSETNGCAMPTLLPDHDWQYIHWHGFR